jgi:hypothetical protein
VKLAGLSLLARNVRLTGAQRIEGAIDPDIGAAWPGFWPAASP